MGKIVVFDSGLGSLSIILAIRQVVKADIVYFADQKNYPYGKKSQKELRKIIKTSIKALSEKFQPNVIVVGSNTPTLLFPDLFENDGAVMGVSPPLVLAQKQTSTNSIGILATAATIQSKQLNTYIKTQTKKNIQVTKIDATTLIDLVESGKFLTDKQQCMLEIKKTLKVILHKNNIDVVTLSSTHLSFLAKPLQTVFPQITFLDPAMHVATQLIKNIHFLKSKRNSLQIFSSGNIHSLQSKLAKMKIKNQVHPLKF
jgi:glutamate racemase